MLDITFTSISDFLNSNIFNEKADHFHYEILKLGKFECQKDIHF